MGKIKVPVLAPGLAQERVSKPLKLACSLHTDGGNNMHTQDDSDVSPPVRLLATLLIETNYHPVVRYILARTLPIRAQRSELVSNSVTSLLESYVENQGFRADREMLSQLDKEVTETEWREEARAEFCIRRNWLASRCDCLCMRFFESISSQGDFETTTSEHVSEYIARIISRIYAYTSLVSSNITVDGRLDIEMERDKLLSQLLIEYHQSS